MRQRKRETRPYTERTLTVSTRLERFTHKAREEPRQRFNALMGLLFERKTPVNRIYRPFGTMINWRGEKLRHGNAECTPGFAKRQAN